MRTDPFLLVLSISTPLLLLACGGNGTTGGGGSGGATASNSVGTSGNGNTSTSTSGNGNTSTSTSGNGNTSTSTSGNGSSSTSGSGGPGACPIFPADNPWNTDISNAKVDPLSATYIASIGPAIAFHPDFGSTGGIPYVYVDNSVMKSPVSFTYASESDVGPYPIPQNPPIEMGSDAHLLMVQTDECKLYELFGTAKQAAGWHAGSGAIFDLKSNMLRPDGWTSADAAGLPILPGLAKYEEASGAGMNHALRFTVQTTQSAYAYPARHSAGAGMNTSLPPMGMRVRLKASFDVSVLSPQAKWVANTLKKYGMILADNGSNWYITGAPHASWDDNDLHNLNKIHGSDMEVIETGPLTPGD